MGKENSEDEIEKVKKASKNKRKGLRDGIDTSFLQAVKNHSTSFLSRLRGFLIKKKALPIYLLLGASYISSFRSSNFLFQNGTINDQLLWGNLQFLIGALNKSFVFGSPIKLLTTFLVIGSLWSGYSYWLKSSIYLKNSYRLLRKVIIAVITVVLLERHVRTGSVVSDFSQWIVFIITVYIELTGTWFIAKTIDNIDLSSDLKNWALRLLGLPVVFTGSLLSIIAQPTFSTEFSPLIYSNNVFLGGLLLMVLGAFMMYRSTRRQPALKIW